VGFAHYAEREFSEETAREIDCAARELVAATYEKALTILRQYRAQLDEGANLLLEKETLVHEELPLLDDLKPAAAAVSETRACALAMPVHA
jgi:cell division protease FtsH